MIYVCLGIMMAVIGYIGVVNYIKKDFPAFIATVIAFVCGVLVLVTSMFGTVSERKVEKLCEQNSVSYTFVSTVSELTGAPIEEVYLISERCMRAGLEVTDAVLLTDPSLTLEQANAIVTISDLRQQEPIIPVDEFYMEGEGVE